VLVRDIKLSEHWNPRVYVWMPFRPVSNPCYRGIVAYEPHGRRE